MKNSIENKDEKDALAELRMLKEQVKEVCWVEILGKQDFNFDAQEVFEPIIRTLHDPNRKLAEESMYIKNKRRNERKSTYRNLCCN